MIARLLILVAIAALVVIAALAADWASLVDVLQRGFDNALHGFAS